MTDTHETLSEKLEETTPKLTKETIVRRLEEIANSEEIPERTEIDALKQSFYKMHNAEVEAARGEFVANGGKEEEFTPLVDPLEEPMKKALSVIKERRSEANAELEKEKEMNLQIKLSIIEELKELIESPDDANKNYVEFKKLQQQWNDTKLLPANTSLTELWKNYQVCVEKFYDLLKLNNEFREYDFKKNYEIKTRLCEAAEKLAEESDVVSAFHQLQNLHQEFRETGPVSKELRESIWARFKAASTVVNRRHQQHFEALREAEQTNLMQKTVICEIIEAFDLSQLKSYVDWDNKTKEVIALQTKWKTIGFAPQKMNVKIFERFRKSCDDFFQAKAAFFKTQRESASANLEKKRLLCEKAESLKDSTDWKVTSEALMKLQKEWKEVGPVAKKQSDILWKRFIEACDYFFKEKNKATSSQRQEEKENLSKKRAVIERLQQIKEEADDEAAKAIRELTKAWNEIGHVPFKDKDKIYKQYRALVDEIYDRINKSNSGKRIKSAIANVQETGVQALIKEREKLLRAYEGMKTELQTYENNMGFLTAASKKGSNLLSEVNRKVEKLKADILQAKQDIDSLTEEVNNHSEEK